MLLAGDSDPADDKVIKIKNEREIAVLEPNLSKLSAQSAPILDGFRHVCGIFAARLARIWHD